MCVISALQHTWHITAVVCLDILSSPPKKRALLPIDLTVSIVVRPRIVRTYRDRAIAGNRILLCLRCVCICALRTSVMHKIGYIKFAIWYRAIAQLSANEN